MAFEPVERRTQRLAESRQGQELEGSQSKQQRSGSCGHGRLQEGTAGPSAGLGEGEKQEFTEMQRETQVSLPTMNVFRTHCILQTLRSHKVN